jgi:16S rRNA (guanine1516-N2)-methyltransferase
MPDRTPLPISLVLCVAADPPRAALGQAAAALAQGLNLPLIDLADPPPEAPDAPEADAALVLTDRRLELRVLRGDPLLVGGHGVASELTQIDTTSGPGRSLSQPLVKAVGIRKRDAYRPTVFDATAGLGEDAWVLASLGCTVHACERNAVTHALLVDGLARAGATQPEIAARMSVTLGEGVEVLKTLADAAREDRPDVVTLDPMFPPGRKTAERKAMRVLRLIGGDDADADQLLVAALGVAKRRVVVKRPLRAAALNGPEPTMCHEGKSLRFDVYVVS